LWSHEAKAGASEGRKDRPYAIGVAVPRDPHGDTRVVVVPITHTPPRDPATAIVLPRSVKATLGLDAENAWVRLDELNIFSWPGYDLRTVPDSDRIDYGPLPRALFERIREGVTALHRKRRATLLNRD
jgi:hypothetical protein